MTCDATGESITHTPTCTVLIPSYRRPDALAKCLNALSLGTRLPDEIVVVLRDIDTDSQAALQDWMVQSNIKNLNLRLVVADRPGQIVAMNTGLVVASQDVVCFTDDDCEPHADWLERLLAYYAAPDVGGVGGRDIVHEDGQILSGEVHVVGRIMWYGRIIGNHHLEYNGPVLDVHHLKGANMSFRHNLLRPFDEQLSGGSSCLNDTDVSLWVRQQGYRLIYDPQVKVDHFPAARFDTSTRQKTDLALVQSDSHNWIYCLMKYSGLGQCVIIILYALLIGSGTRLGLLKWLLRLPLGPGDTTRQFIASTRGKLAGIRTYLSALKQDGES